MADKTITSANSVFTIVVPGLYPAPVQIQGYAVDKSVMTDAADSAEMIMGVDGKMSAGYTPTPRKVTISLQADSSSRDIFSAINQAQKTAREVLFLNATLVLPATGEAYTMTRGVLGTLKEFPDGAKTLQPVDYVTTWESINRAIL